MKNMWGAVANGGNDVEKINIYKEETLPVFDAMCAEANGKFLMGTDDLTLLDTHIGPMWEGLFMRTGPVFAHVDEILQIETNAPNWCAYMRKFRNHPAIKPHRMNRAANDANGILSKAKALEDPPQRPTLTT